ncbi:uncharacterized protein LOC142979875 [Anticarsia gemmatalis]|uniref:uncharacterized protein LOC142979875 n=1 Tax=Anticarsia gemmatalis TaxID=129554 RepID=UPI003F7633FB
MDSVDLPGVYKVYYKSHLTSATTVAMNAYTLFALLVCAIVAMASGVPMRPEEHDMAAAPASDLLEGAESRGYGQHHGGGGGGYHHGGGGGGYHHGGGNHGGGHHGGGHGYGR